MKQETYRQRDLETRKHLNKEWSRRRLLSTPPCDTPPSSEHDGRMHSTSDTGSKTLPNTTETTLKITKKQSKPKRKHCQLVTEKRREICSNIEDEQKIRCCSSERGGQRSSSRADHFATVTSTPEDITEWPAVSRASVAFFWPAFHKQYFAASSACSTAARKWPITYELALASIYPIAISPITFNTQIRPQRRSAALLRLEFSIGHGKPVNDSGSIYRVNCFSR